MSERLTNPTIDKSTWGDGPWQTEPDRVEWTHAGLPCLALRNHHGNWCGYAAVPPGHPRHGHDYDDGDVDVSVHGGLTYASACGFDCCHCGDFSPGMSEPPDVVGFTGLRHVADVSVARLNRSGFPWSGKPYDHAHAVAANRFDVDVYRTLDYVQAETNNLADQLAALR